MVKKTWLGLAAVAAALVVFAKKLWGPSLKKTETGKDKPASGDQAS